MSKIQNYRNVHTYSIARLFSCRVINSGYQFDSKNEFFLPVACCIILSQTTGMSELKLGKSVPKNNGES